ncbi:fibronectin type III domain-containing protein [Streptomyces sp. NPDC012888]|uniref:fibronectin type III domain-containing protein n=1 Tax=Streptomyces sp. NPDC012888 TaxID=3364855 RepID=UPI0036C8A8B0
MKLRYAAGAAVLLTPVLFVGMTEPAAARNTHTMWIRGVLNVRDAGGEVTGGSFSQAVDLTHDATSGTFRFSRCAGGETTGVLVLTFYLRRDETVTPNGTLSLYEGTRCDDPDREGTIRVSERPILLGKVRSEELVVRNREFLSDDSTSAEFSITHRVAAVDVGRPTEASNVVATAVPVGDEKTVRVDWEDDANNETGYEVRNTTLNQNFGVGANTKTFSVPHLDPKVRYCFQVRAVGNQGPSDWTPVGEKAECA